MVLVRIHICFIILFYFCSYCHLLFFILLNPCPPHVPPVSCFLYIPLTTFNLSLPLSWPCPNHFTSIHHSPLFPLARPLPLCYSIPPSSPSLFSLSRPSISSTFFFSCLAQAGGHSWPGLISPPEQQMHEQQHLLSSISSSSELCRLFGSIPLS